jgi:predicted peptidase
VNCQERSLSLELKFFSILIIFLTPIIFSGCRPGNTDTENQVASVSQFPEFERNEHIAQNDVWMPYRILYPEPYDSTKKYPLVIFLHGVGERGGDNEKQLVHGASLFLKEDNRKKYPCVVIFPQCPNEGYWASAKIDRSTKPVTFDFDYSRNPTPSLFAAMEIMDKTIREERVDRLRVYILGLSMGGMGTFEAIHRYPEKFAAAVPICGGGDTLRYTKKVKGFPFFIFHGEEDNVVSVDHSRRMVDKLRKLGAKVRYVEYPDVKHASWNNALAEDDLLPWLFSQVASD